MMRSWALYVSTLIKPTIVGAIVGSLFAVDEMDHDVPLNLAARKVLIGAFFGLGVGHKHYLNLTDG